jgi:spermidine synthase
VTEVPHGWGRVMTRTVAADFVHLAQEYSTALAFETEVLRALDDEVGFDVAYISVKGAEASPTVSRLEPDIVAQAVAGGPRYFRELLPVKRAALAAHGVAVDSAVLGQTCMHRAAYYRELMCAVGAQHSLLAYLPLRGSIIGMVMLGRSGTGFRARDIEFMESRVRELGVARAAYGLPVTFPALGVRRKPRLLERVGLAKGTYVRASARIGGTTVEVRDRGAFREMVALQGGHELIWTRAALADPSESGWPYIELLHVAAALAKSRRRALFIGCGGAVALRQFAGLYPGIELDLVEREAAVVELARTWFALDAIAGLNVHVADGAAFVGAAAPASWDVAVVDAFDSANPSSALSEPAFFAALARVLQPRGALAINVIGTLDRAGVVDGVVQALRREFDVVRILPVVDHDERFSASTLRNVVVVATRGHGGTRA